MFLRTTADGSLIEVMDLRQLFDPFAADVSGRLHAGEELQDQNEFHKTELTFPSGEALPSCWVNPAYPHP